MALLHLEGFEGYSSVNDLYNVGSTNACKWVELNANGNTLNLGNATWRTTQVTAANSRSMCLSTNFARNQFSIPATTEIIVGIGFYPTTAVSTNSIISVGGAGTVDTKGVTIGLNVGRNIIVSTPGNWGSPNSTLSTGTTVVTLNTWHYLEVRAKLGAATGECEVWLDGVQELNLSSLNTATGGITSYNMIGVGCTYSNSHTTFYDDFYVCDKTGSTNNTFLGPISVYTLMPTGAGSSTQLTATGAATNWQAVSEAANNTTTYVSTSTTAQKDYYTFQSLPAGVTSVQGVLLKARSTLPTAGTRKLKLNLKNGASVITSALKALLLGTWAEDSFVSDTAPDGTAWDPTKVNATEGGVEAG